MWLLRALNRVRFSSSVRSARARSLSPSLIGMPISLRNATQALSSPLSPGM